MFPIEHVLLTPLVPLSKQKQMQHVSIKPADSVLENSKEIPFIIPNSKAQLVTDGPVLPDLWGITSPMLPLLTYATSNLWLPHSLMGFHRTPCVPIPSHSDARKYARHPPRIVGGARKIRNVSCTVHEVNGGDSFQKPDLEKAQQAPNPTLGSPDPPFLNDCQTCNNTGFVPCSKCNAEGLIRNPRSVNVFYCPDCVGYKKLRCPTCGGKCYLCD